LSSEASRVGKVRIDPSFAKETEGVATRRPPPCPPTEGLWSARACSRFGFGTRRDSVISSPFRSPTAFDPRRWQATALQRGKAPAAGLVLRPKVLGVRGLDRALDSELGRTPWSLFRSDHQRHSISRREQDAPTPLKKGKAPPVGIGSPTEGPWSERACSRFGFGTRKNFVISSPFRSPTAFDPKRWLRTWSDILKSRGALRP